MGKIIVIAPHPDDETLGCGGSLLKHKEHHDEIYWLIVTSMKEEDGWETSEVEKRRDELNEVSNAYGFKKIFNLDFPTTKLDLIPINALVTSISKVVDDIKPNTIYIPNRSDIHSDHRKTFESAMSACKSFRMDFIKKILMYECLSETEFASSLQENAFSPNYFVDISKYLEEEINILKVFKSELREFPFPRSEINIRALASYRGATANVKAAEAFVLIKEIA